MLNWNEIEDRKTYRQDRADLLVLLEGSTLTPYVDSVGDPTIGIGFNLVYNLEPVLRVIVGKTNFSEALLARLEAEVDKTYAPNSSSALISNLNRIMADWHDRRDGDVPSTFAFRNEAQVAKALNALAPAYDRKIDSWLADIPDSNERAALFSLCWNAPSLLGPKLKAAIEDGNRAEAWYEIRYNSNGNGIAGLANRRYVEAETFGLFDTDGQATFGEAVKAGRMLAAHHQTMLSYEDRYDPETAADIKGMPGIDSIAGELAPAIRTILKSLGLAPRTHAEELLVAGVGGSSLSGDGTDFDTAQNDDDLILGGKGKDTQSGNAGSDILAGLKGADMLRGGGGADVFVFSAIRDSTARAGDRIEDFGTGADRLALSGLGDLDLLDRKNAAFTGNGSEIRWSWSDGDTIVEVDLDGDEAADLKIVLSGELTLGQADFLL